MVPVARYTQNDLDSTKHVIRTLYSPEVVLQKYQFNFTSFYLFNLKTDLSIVEPKLIRFVVWYTTVVGKTSVKHPQEGIVSDIELEI